LLAGANTKSSDNTATSWRLNAFDQFCQLVGCFVWKSKI